MTKWSIVGGHLLLRALRLVHPKNGGKQYLGGSLCRVLSAVAC